MIEKLKAEIFDIIRAQDTLKIKYAELEQRKQERLKQLKGVEDEKKV